MTGTAHTAGAIAAGAFTLPALGFALGPIFKKSPHNWESVGTTADFNEDNYVPVTFTLTPGIGEAWFHPLGVDKGLAIVADDLREAGEGMINGL